MVADTTWSPSQRVRSSSVAKRVFRALATAASASADVCGKRPNSARASNTARSCLPPRGAPAPALPSSPFQLAGTSPSAIPRPEPPSPARRKPPPGPTTSAPAASLPGSTTPATAALFPTGNPAADGRRQSGTRPPARSSTRHGALPLLRPRVDVCAGRTDRRSRRLFDQRDPALHRRVAAAEDRDQVPVSVHRDLTNAVDDPQIGCAPLEPAVLEGPSGASGAGRGHSPVLVPRNLAYQAPDVGTGRLAQPFGRAVGGHRPSGEDRANSLT
ncbi:hypothetical protein SVIOM74S_08741 [Streptomyces violarus]